jgi:predicted transcriptional regulator
MKVKRIQIKSREEFEKGLKSAAQSLDEGKTPKKTTGTFFESLDAVRSVLTDKRLELWRTIRDKKPASISVLAGMVHRNFRAVHRDVMLLKELGLVKLQKAKGDRGDIQSPVSIVDQLVLSVA